jgi:hypothetical protein
MTPHLKQRMIDVGRRARVLFAAISYAREGDRTLVDDLMAEVNAAWRRICQETEEMLEVYAYLLDQLEMHFAGSTAEGRTCVFARRNCSRSPARISWNWMANAMGRVESPMASRDSAQRETENQKRRERRAERRTQHERHGARTT